MRGVGFFHQNYHDMELLRSVLEISHGHFFCWRLEGIQMSEKSEKLKNNAAALLSAVLLTIVAFLINRGIRIAGLYMDDLYMWSCYGEQNFLQFVFPIGTSTRCRPVYWALTYLEMMIVRSHPSLFVPINILLNAGIAFMIFLFARKLSRQNAVGFLAGCAYLFSHFSYYQIAQALGLLETAALFFAILQLFLLYEFLESGNFRFFRWAVAVWLLLVFTHERYLGLFPLFFLAFFLREREKGEKTRWLDLILPIVSLLLIIAVRSFAIGHALPAGTGGTEVKDTFSIRQSIRYALDEVLYLFGINIGPDYLSGITWSSVSAPIKKMVYGSWIPLLFIFFFYLRNAERQGKLKQKYFIADNLLFILFIALCIGCSSVTIRVEMRWVYVSYAASLLYLSYMIGQSCSDRNGRILGGIGRKRGRCLFLLMLCYVFLMLFIEKYYRSYYPNIYFWENQDRMNSLADETVGKYGTENVLGKQVYILGNSYEMSDFYAETFFKVYDPKKTGQGTTIHFIKELSDLPEGSSPSNSLVLREVPEKRGYEDITDEAFGNAGGSAG